MLKEVCKKFFLLEREWNFDETLSVVCEAVSVMVNYDDISDKALMYQLLVDCDETLTKEYESGNEMATAMFSRKKGKALLEAMRLTKMEAELVAKYIDGLPPAAVAISDAIALCQPDILLVDMLVVVAATECFRKAVTDFAAARPTNEGLQEYMQQATKDTLANPSLSWLQLVTNGWKSLLSSVLVSTTTEDSLVEWVREAADKPSRLTTATEFLVKNPLIFPKSLEKDIAIALSNVYDFILDANALCQSGFSDTEKCTAMRNKCKSGVILLGLDDYCEEKGGAFSRSPLMEASSSFRARVREGSFAVGTKLLMPVQSAVFGNGLLTYTTRDIDFAGADAQTLDLYQAWVCDLGVIAKAASWATESKDTKLTAQLSCLAGLVDLVKRLAETEAIARRTVRDARGNFNTKKVTKETADILKDLRSYTHTFRVTLEADGAEGCFMKPDPEAEVDADHCTWFDNGFDVGVLGKSLLNKSIALQREFGSLWAEHIEVFLKMFDSFTPPSFVMHKENLLQNDQACRDLLLNEDGYKRLGPLCAEAKVMGKLMKTVQKDGEEPMVNPSLIKSLLMTADVGIEVACFTYLVFFVRRDIPTYESLEKVCKATQTVRAKFHDCGVTLTEQCDQALKDLVDGKPCTRWILGDGEAQPSGSVPAQEVAPAAVEVAPAAVEPDSSMSGSRPVPKVASPAVAAQAEEPVPKRTRLLDKLKGRPALPVVAQAEAPKRMRLLDKLKAHP